MKLTYAALFFLISATSAIRLVNLATSKCLDSNGKGDVYALGCNGGNYQNWDKRGTNFVNVATGKCLDSNSKKEVYALPCNGGSYQEWVGDNVLKNLATGFVLDSNGDGEVYTKEANGGSYQHWQYTD